MSGVDDIPNLFINAALQRQKRAVQLTENISRTEAMMEQQIRERLEKGLPLDDLMR